MPSVGSRAVCSQRIVKTCSRVTHLATLGGELSAFVLREDPSMHTVRWSHRNSPQNASSSGLTAPSSLGYLFDHTVTALRVSRARNLAVANSSVYERGSEAPLTGPSDDLRNNVDKGAAQRTFSRSPQNPENSPRWRACRHGSDVSSLKIWGAIFAALCTSLCCDMDNNIDKGASWRSFQGRRKFLKTCQCA